MAARDEQPQPELSSLDQQKAGWWSKNCLEVVQSSCQLHPLLTRSMPTPPTSANVCAKCVGHKPDLARTAMAAASAMAVFPLAVGAQTTTDWPARNFSTACCWKRSKVYEKADAMASYEVAAALVACNPPACTQHESQSASRHHSSIVQIACDIEQALP